jgi:hypothetical protein
VWLEVGSGKAASSRPTHQRVTPAVSPQHANMLNIKVTRSITLAILAGILSYSIVQACSLPAPIIYVKCSNFETSIIDYSLSPLAGETYEDFERRWAHDIFENLHAVTPNCAEDLSPVLATFEQEIVKWLNLKKSGLLGNSLILEPYSAERASELQKNKSRLLSCRYAEYQQVGTWLIVFPIK